MNIILKIVKKEFLQFSRDPKMFGIILIAPVIQLIFFGYAVNFEVENVHTALLDRDKSEVSRGYIEDFQSSGYFDFDYYVESYEEIDDLINNGKVILGLVIPADFEKRIKRNETVRVQAIFDGSDGNTGAISAGYVSGLTNNFNRNILLERKELSGQKVNMAGSVSSVSRIWYNPELKTRFYMVPAIVGLLLMMVTIMLTSLAIVKEKEIGTMEQLIVTPITPRQMIAGKLIPFVILGFISEIIILTAMTLIFDIAIRGSITFLFFATLVYILSTLGLGLFVSTISKTQQQAMMLSIFVAMLPMVYLSGFAFPIENMPEVLQYVTYLIPLRYFMTIIRGVILKGTGLIEHWPDLLALFVIGISILLFSSLRYRKRLE